MRFSSNFLHNDIPNRVGNIWVFWKEGLDINLIGLSHQQITVKVGNSVMSFVHASCAYGIRRELWDELSFLGSGCAAWAIVGDFNIVTSSTERKGGGILCFAAVTEFNSFIHSNALVDSTTMGFKYSWCNKRIGAQRMYQKIDKILVNQQWIDSSAGWRSRIMKRKLSDHSPIVGWNTKIPKPTNIPFRFKRAWILHANLKEVIEKSWSEPLFDVPIRKVTKKLKRLKMVLKDWNYRIYGNFEQHIKQIDNELELILKDQEL
ncbi:hypothetical protein IFM89_004816 [Coptis chinensis]|uniref:Uncharacterized protein n=1 Tax=Coptis chinensis TaxID=261450 RepID=A0A835IRF4_9MAGN|nr:hypothetical protein IFM89_004816 [Coptis chinensis]